MMRPALRTPRFGKGGFLATFVALLCGTAIVPAEGSCRRRAHRCTPRPRRRCQALKILPVRAARES